ncbi:MAG TPA: DUF1566 domain-containing protein [Polyangiales bacterium]
MGHRRYPRPLLFCLGAALCAFSVRGGSADAPAGHFMVGDETVEDSATKLVWERASNATARGASDAGDYCATLDLQGAGWRLPTIKELYTLVDESRTVPAIDTEVFPETAPSFYWSSSSVAGFAEFTWAVDFGQGADGWFPDDKQNFVRCVRPAAPPP